jgi:hypothetical protein
MLKKNIGVTFQKIIELFTLLKNRAMGSGIRDPKKPIPDSGSRGQKGTGSRIRNTGITIAVEQRMGMGKHREYLMYYRGPGFLAVL